MTRNIVMAVVLLLLIAVAAYVFYERSKEKDEKTTSNANPNGTSTPQGNQPLPRVIRTLRWVERVESLVNRPYGRQTPTWSRN